MVHGALPISELDSECMTLLSWNIFSGRVHRNYILLLPAINMITILAFYFIYCAATSPIRSMWAFVSLLSMELVNGLRLRGVEDQMSAFESSPVPASLLSLSSKTARADDGGIDWWLWVVIGGLVALAALITVSFRKPASPDSAEERKLVLSTTIISCQQIVTRSSPGIDPMQLGVTVKGKSASGEFIELFHEETAHEVEGGSSKFGWDEDNFSWIMPQPLGAIGPFPELLLQVEQYSTSGGLIAVVASGIVTLKPPVVGSMITPRLAPQVVELVSTTSGSSVWGSLEIGTKYDSIDSASEQFSVAQKQIMKKLRVVKPIFLASHSLAVVLIILDSFFGIRFLFSGCLASSIQAIVSAGVIALLSIPMAAEWGQMHYNMPAWVVKVGKLNSQFKATVLLLCAIPQQVLASVTGSSNCADLFSVVGGLTFLDFLLFSVLFVQSEANGHFAALFHFNCFKRPLPPALPSAKSVDSDDSGVSPGSYAAKRLVQKAKPAK